MTAETRADPLEDPRRFALRDAADDVRKSHAPNEWDSCVACQKMWPCDAELLAELVMTVFALTPGAPDHE